MSNIVWEEVQVHWCQARRWVVRGVIASGESQGFAEYLDDFESQADAIEEAKIYAFDTSCGPERARNVKVFTKNDTVKKVIEAA
jgi:hypothetical protein